LALASGFVVDAGARDGIDHMMTAASVTLRTTEVFSGVIVLTAVG